MTKVTASPACDPSAISASIARTAEDYDAAPYPSYPYPHLQPNRLSAIAHLFGLSTQPPSTARTLEIGCAAGGHIIPLAAASPRARFVGIDVSPVQIGQGLARVERLGLTNIELRCRSVTDLGPEQGSFDYIICHGVYSWAPEAVREAVLRVCQERLASDGVAVISYNVLPGWRMFQIVRDCAILHAGAGESQAGLAERVRELLDICEKHTPEKTSYGQIWRNEAQKMRNLPDSYLVHELFEQDNSPCTVSQFAAAAKRHDLAYLGEANVWTMIPEAMVPEAAQVVRDLSGSEILAAEQYIDMISGRTFRQTLLMHEPRQSAIDRSLDPARIADLHILAPPGFKTAESEIPGEYAFDDGTGRIMSTSDSAVQQSIERFIARQPSSSSLAELAPPGHTNAEDQQKIAEAFMKMLSLGMVRISTEAVNFPAEIPERPKAWFVAASDAASRAPATASRRHENFSLDPLASVLLPLLDGTRCRDDLVTLLSSQAADGHIVVRDTGGEALLDGDRLREAAIKLVDRCLRALMRGGILVE